MSRKTSGMCWRSVYLFAILWLSAVSGQDETPPWEEVCPHTICVDVIDRDFIDNPLNCSTFFQCVDGRAIDGSCPSGTWFNPDSQKCDVPWNVPCDAEASESVELECVPEPGDPPPPLQISCHLSDAVHMVQHPTDCTKFFICVGGQAEERTCAPGLEFNVHTQQCMQPEDAMCEPPVCPAINVPITFVPSETHCNGFSICFNEVPVPHECAEGFHWDQQNGWCDFPENVECTLEDKSEEIESGFECHDGSPIFNPNPTDCTRYYLCDPTGEAHPQQCAENMFFDINTKACTDAYSVTCYPGSGNNPEIAFKFAH